MTLTGALVIYAVLWFMGMLIALPIGLRTHGDQGTVDEVTPAYAPVNANIRRKVRIVSLISLVLWVPICLLIFSGWISISDIDLFGRMD